MNDWGICGPKFWLLDKPGEDKSGRRCFPKILITVGPVGSEVFFYIITYFFNKIKLEFFSILKTAAYAPNNFAQRIRTGRRARFGKNWMHIEVARSGEKFAYEGSRSKFRLSRLSAAGLNKINHMLHFGKFVRGVGLLEVAKKSHMGCLRAEFGPGQLSTARRVSLD